MSEGNIQLDYCGCCEGIRKLTPVTIKNQPGLSALKYRVGTHSQFKASMITSLSQQRALQNLRTREDDDLAIAILDSCATVADVLTFYQERIANEGFLRTATERRSILELARSVGYELRPGVAASTFLAFTVEDTVESTKVDEETKAQSLPGEGETPQIFETVEEIEARAEWNKLKPQLTKPQTITAGATEFYLKGTDTRLKSGDGLLLVISDEDTETSFKIITDVETDEELQRTNVKAINVPYNQPESVTSSSVPVSVTKSRGATITKLKDITSEKKTQSEWTAFAITNNLSLRETFEVINLHAPELVAESLAGTHLYAFRIRTGFFGSNAPQYDVKPDGTRCQWTDVPINKKSDGTTYHTQDGKLIYLDNSYQSVLPDSLIVLLSHDGYRAYRINETIEESVTDFSLSSRVTGLILNITNGAELSDFTIRKTTAYIQSEELVLAEQPIESLVEGNSITLDHLVYGLKEGQLISITGTVENTQVASEGLTKSEVAVISKLVHGLYTEITFTPSLQNKYKRDTVTLNANVARATHGETKEEVLGGGDPSQRQQQFALKQTPLTYVSARTTSGAESTLKVHVDDVRWKEVPSLYNLETDDHAYTIRTDDDGKTRIIFGDGTRGVRPAAGTENIKATYRIGIGISSMLKEGQLSLLMSRPLGVRSVTNPIAPVGADDPEDRDNARENAPLTVLTMDRIVSLKDVENFALAFAGIGKARAVWAWNGEKRVVYLTVASATGERVEEGSDQYENLTDAIDAYKDPLIQVKVKSFNPIPLNIEAKIAVAQDREFETVKPTIEEVLKKEFSFDSMQFGQPVTKSKVMAVIQGVDGVVAVDIDALYRSDKERKLNDMITANIEQGELLILNPDAEDMLKEMKL